MKKLGLKEAKRLKKNSGNDGIGAFDSDLLSGKVRNGSGNAVFIKTDAQNGI